MFFPCESTKNQQLLRRRLGSPTLQGQSLSLLCDSRESPHAVVWDLGQRSETQLGGEHLAASLEGDVQTIWPCQYPHLLPILPTRNAQQVAPTGAKAILEGEEAILCIFLFCECCCSYSWWSQQPPGLSVPTPLAPGCKDNEEQPLFPQTSIQEWGQSLQCPPCASWGFQFPPLTPQEMSFRERPLLKTPGALSILPMQNWRRG